MQLHNQTYIPREDTLLSAICSSTRTHTHPPNDPPSPTHATAIITHTDTSLHYINTPLKANQTVTPTKALHNLSIKQTNKNKRTSSLGDLRLGLPPSRGPPSQGHPSWRHPSRGHPSQDHPSRSHPSQRHPSRGHPSQGHPSRRHPSQGHPSRRHPSQGHPSMGHPSQGHPSRRHPSQDHPSRRHPSQGHPSRGHPSHGHPSRGHPSRGRPSSRLRRPKRMAQADIPKMERH